MKRVDIATIEGPDSERDLPQGLQGVSPDQRPSSQSWRPASVLGDASIVLGYD